MMDTRLLVEWVIFTVNSFIIFKFSALNFNMICRVSFNNFFNSFIV